MAESTHEHESTTEQLRATRARELRAELIASGTIKPSHTGESSTAVVPIDHAAARSAAADLAESASRATLDRMLGGDAHPLVLEALQRRIKAGDRRLRHAAKFGPKGRGSRSRGASLL